MSRYEKSSKRQTEEMAEIVEKWLRNPLSKYFLKHATKREDGERRIEKILKDYSYREDVDLTLRDRFWEFVVSKIFSLVTNRTSITEEDIKSNLKQDHWRKGLATTLEGLAWRGPEKPFTSYAPFLIVWNFTLKLGRRLPSFRGGR